MDRLKSINPDRIHWCCAERHISINELASEVRIPFSTLENTINQEAGLTFNQLKKVAEYFGRGVLFFLEKDPVNADLVHTAQFRTLTNQKPEISPKTKALIERAEKQRAIYLNLIEELDAEDQQLFTPPELQDITPIEAARITRDWLGLSSRNTFETYRSAIEARGVLVFRSNGYNGKWQIPKDSPILGFSLYDETCPLIVVKKQNPETRQTFTLIHELGHLLLHKASSIDDAVDLYSQDGVEQDANAFAGNLLVPSTFLQTINDRDRPAEVSEIDFWLSDYRTSWGVSTEVILRRLLNAGRLSSRTYTHYRTWRAEQPEVTKGGGNRMYRHREPKHLFGDKFVQTVLDALNARQITITKASRYLDSLKIHDLHRLENFYAGL